ncbi:hypothetical protein [Brevibacterium yomogidense]|uniref:hypothetical protein n=2 Tax=Brevibacterium yomogidense TaxID=946573 RepID=UPI0018E044D4|nr:hypothetical protein [Brevibacterium yomogidense]
MTAIPVQGAAQTQTPQDGRDTMADATPFSAYLAGTPTEQAGHLARVADLAREHPDNPIGLTLILEQLETMSAEEPLAVSRA